MTSDSVKISSGQDVQKFGPALAKVWGIALTGGIASGKTAVAEILRLQGQLVFDADHLSRQATEPHSVACQKIAAFFGPKVFAADGVLNRKELGQRVWQDAAARAALEDIMHPAIHAELYRALERENLFELPRLWFYEAALVIEKQRIQDFKEVWLVVCSAETQLTRLIERENISREAAELRIKNQMNTYEKRKFATRIIDSEKPLKDVALQVAGLLSIIGPA